MSSVITKDDLTNRNQTAKLIAVCLILTAVGVLAFSLFADSLALNQTPNPAQVLALRGGVAALAIAVIVLRRKRFQSVSLIQAYKSGGQAKLFAYLQVTTIMLAALCEAIVALGIISFFLSGEKLEMMFAAIICLLMAIFYVYPRTQNWRQILAHVEANT